MIYSQVFKIIKPPRRKFSYNYLMFLSNKLKQYIETTLHNLDSRSI